MRQHQAGGALGALLQVLEEGERLVAEEASFPSETRRETVNSYAPHHSPNRLVEQIASAMLKLRTQEGY